MEKVLAKYETLFIVDSSMPDDAVDGLIAKFNDLIAANGTVDKVDKWGVRQLAYAIDNRGEGCYVLIEFTSEPSFTPELERIYNITDGILRSIVIKLN